MPTCEIMFSAAQIGEKLKVFLLGAIYTWKPQNGGNEVRTSYGVLLGVLQVYILNDITVISSFFNEKYSRGDPTVNFLLNKKNTNNSIQEETKREACPRRAAELN